MNTIKIFLASSEEMRDDRVAFNSFIGDENKTFYQKDIFLKLEVWPDFAGICPEFRNCNKKL